MYPGNVIGAKDIDLTVRDKEFCVLVGPSGCGKSTTLRMIAGLEDVTSGEIYIDGKLVNDVQPKDRNIAMVFQNYALYPHMTVYENMAFGLRLRKYPKAEIDNRVKQAAKILGITSLLQRRPKELSGGQRQRVAVGRAIVRKPKVFLFDEPLSNLDAKLRVQMRAELKKLHERLESTVIYVTHDQVEAMTMGDKIAVLKDGYLQQVATPAGVYTKPATRFVAGFIGSPAMNFLECTVECENGDLYFNEGSFRVKAISDMNRALEPWVGKQVIFGVRPEDIYDRLYAKGASADNTFRATVDVVEPLGSEIYLHLKTAKNEMIVRVSADNKAQLHQDIDFVIDMSKIHIFDAEGATAII
jgi:multiple sugar transport system ATP-binding protein